MKTIEQRVQDVAEIIKDKWPHRMSLSAARSIENYYRGHLPSLMIDYGTVVRTHAKGLNLTTLREVSSARSKRWLSTAEPWSLADHSNELAGETGEACNVVKKIRRIQTGAGNPKRVPDMDDLLIKLAEELADVVICADLLANAAGIDLSSAVEEKFNATSVEMGFPERL